MNEIPDDGEDDDLYRPSIFDEPDDSGDFDVHDHDAPTATRPLEDIVSDWYFEVM